MNSEYIKKAGIYKLICVPNGKVYIGKSIDLSRRLNYHKNCSKKTKGLFYLQNAIIKYGWENFKVEIIQIFENFDKINDNVNLLEKESEYIKFFDSTNPQKGYNRCEYSNDLTGKILTEEHKNKIRKSNLGRVFTETHKKNLSLSSKGRIISKETREKMSKSKLGVPSHRKGKQLSVETRKKISDSKSGKPSNRLGVKLSDETIRKMKVSHRKNKQDKYE